MGYVENNLMDGEEIVYKAKIHWIIFSGSVVLGVLGFILTILGLLQEEKINNYLFLGILILISAIIIFLDAIISWKTSEFAVTNKRVLIKVGLIKRHSLEILLQKIEGIGVDQSIFGRIFDYGTIVVSGTGGTREPFKNIKTPLEFRKNVQSRIPHT